MKRLYVKFAAAALMCAAVAGCNSDDTPKDYHYGSNRAVAVLAEASDFTQMLVTGEEINVDLHIQLDKPVDRDVYFMMGATQAPVSEYNSRQFGDDTQQYYSLLPTDNYSLGTRVDVPAGATSVKTTLTINGLPAQGNYALAVNISAGWVDYTSIDKNNSTILYVFYREGETPPDPNAAPVISVSGAPDSAEMQQQDDGSWQEQSFMISLRLSKTYDETVTVTLEQDMAVDTPLPASCYTWDEKTVTFNPGEIQKNVTVVVKSLPDYDASAHNYERGPAQTFAVKVADITPEEVGVAGVTARIVLQYPEPEIPFNKTPVVQGAALFKNTVANLTTNVTLGLTLNKWTIEAWVKYVDNSGLTTAAWMDGTSNTNSTNRRKRVYPPMNYPFNIATGNFCFYPLGNSASAPNMTIGQWVSMPYSSKTTDGFCWSPNEWTHLAFVYDGSELKFYINGQPGEYADNAQDNATTAVPQTKGYSQALEGLTDWTTLKLASPGGNGASTASYFRLQMAQLRLWSVVRTEAEINADKAYNINPASPGLEGYWPMNETSGTVLNDITANGRNITSSSTYLEMVTTQTTFANEGTRRAGQAY